MQNKDGTQNNNGGANDIDVVTLLRVLGFKMVIACIDQNQNNTDKNTEKGQKVLSFDFTFNSSNTNRAGIQKLEEKCNKFAISYLCWSGTVE